MISRSTGSAGVLVAGGLLASVAPLLVIAALVSAPGAASGSAPSENALADIPAEYLELYRAAADRYRLGQVGWSYTGVSVRQGLETIR